MAESETIKYSQDAEKAYLDYRSSIDQQSPYISLSCVDPRVRRRAGASP